MSWWYRIGERSWNILNKNFHTSVDFLDICDVRSLETIFRLNVGNMLHDWERLEILTCLGYISLWQLFHRVLDTNQGNLAWKATILVNFFSSRPLLQISEGQPSPSKITKSPKTKSYILFKPRYTKSNNFNPLFPFSKLVLCQPPPKHFF